VSARRRETDALRTLAFIFGLCISSIMAVGIVAPSVLVWIAQQVLASGTLGFYIIAAVRIAFGLILISVGADSRAPNAVRVLGYVIVILGLVTAFSGWAAIAPAQGAVESWLQQDSAVIRLTAVPFLALGGFVAYACAPPRRAA
jgi:hypothetical protein